MKKVTDLVLLVALAVLGILSWNNMTEISSEIHQKANFANFVDVMKNHDIITLYVLCITILFFVFWGIIKILNSPERQYKKFIKKKKKSLNSSPDDDLGERMKDYTC